MKENNQNQQRENKLRSKPRRRGMRRWYKIALAAMILVSAGLYFWLSNSKPFPEQLYQAYYQPYDIPFSQRTQSLDALLSQASTFYKSKQYAEALPLFLSLANIPDDNAEVKLATGICQMELNQYRDAIKTLQPLIEAKDAAYLEQAQWYTALSQLQTHQLDSAKMLLQEVANTPQGSFKQKAQELLGQM